MESHEEKLLAMVQESKMNQAKEIMKQKEKELKSQQPAQSGFSFFTSLLSGVVSGVTNATRPATQPVSQPTQPISQSSYNEPVVSYILLDSAWLNSHEVSSSLGRGMTLTGNKKESLSVSSYSI